MGISSESGATACRRQELKGGEEDADADDDDEDDIGTKEADMSPSNERARVF